MSTEMSTEIKPDDLLTKEEALETIDRIKAGEKYFYEQRRFDYYKVRDYYVKTFDYSIAQEIGVHEDVLRAHVRRVADVAIKKRSFANLSETAVRTFFDAKFIEKADKQRKWKDLREEFATYITDRLKTDDELLDVCKSKFSGKNFAGNLINLYLIKNHTSYLQSKPFEYHYDNLRKRFIGPKPKHRKPLHQLQKISKKHSHRTQTLQLYTDPFKPIPRWLSVELGISEEFLAIKLKEHPEFSDLMLDYSADLFEDLLDLLRDGEKEEEDPKS